ncbi:breast cancer anti-estrogen resistance protein 1 isoform X1 [Erpetoichthys calabaricus]|uniref:breast cancer anti-estrogen resistance protein 1 isoform X1 n=1 Tax=Erpetoichthys calabaricus TaxID=27687 RepID=UPI00223476AF|nr:breast cancer anti-estrogen resistance protein 1 isoform X1 [Erpetoichthys calabaricus]
MSVPVFCKIFDCLQAPALENVLAKALYDNVAESPDELSFRKGDIMTVLERDTQGLDGWWLCSLHGRQGIVPGNRLKIIVGMYDKKQPNMGGSPQSAALAQPPLTPPVYPKQSVYNMPSPSSQYTAMHPAFPNQGDNIYMMPPSHSKVQQNLYQIPVSVQHQYQPSQGNPPLPLQKQAGGQTYQSQPHDVYQVPPSSKSSPQDIYQVPPSVAGPGQEIYQVPPSMNPNQEVYQIPPSLDKRIRDLPKLPGKVVVPTRKGQIYVYDTPKTEQDEYDVPRHLTPSQEIYDVPPNRGGPTIPYGQEVYDTPPMAVKGPLNQDVYDVPPVIEKGLQNQMHPAHMVYDIPPSVSRDLPDGPLREETYDVPPTLMKLRKSPENKHYVSQVLPISTAGLEQHCPEDVYDVPPPASKAQEIYDIPATLRKTTNPQSLQDVYDIPREHQGMAMGIKQDLSEDSSDNVYDVPPQVVRDATATDELSISFKRLSVSSTGSTRSNLSTSSLDVIPVKESSIIKTPAKELNLDLDVAMEMLVKLQYSVESSVSYLMSFISSSWRTPEQMETSLQNIKTAVEKVKNSVKDLLEFARGAVNNAGQASDRTLQAKLGKQVQKMDESYQGLLKYSQALDNSNWALSTSTSGKPSAGDDLDRFVMCSRGIPDDTKQLASFLHGNASLLFKRTKQQATHGDSRLTISLETMSQVTNNNNISAYQTGLPEKANIQSRPLPSPPKFMNEDSPDSQYENTESGWMEDYDYVHLQGKEEFEKNQKQLLEKGNIMKQNKSLLEQQQLKQFERLEQEVSRPIDNDMSNWTPPTHYAQVRSRLTPSDRQLLLFYAEQCEANITTLTNAIDAFYSSINNNQPPKIFVAHSKFVILSAHKLVFIGDTLSRQAKAPEIRNKVTQHSNLLCEMLKEIVVTTKTAALQYPSATAAKDMMDRVRDLANSTQQFKMVLSQLAAM